MTKFFVRLDDLMRVFRWIPAVILVWMAASLAWFAMDRAPPFRILSFNPVTVRSGEFAHVVAKVERQIWRRCSADMSQYVIDSGGTRRSVSYGHFPADMIEEMERVSPGEMRIAFDTDEMPPGGAVLVSVLQYRCNRVHARFPIVVTTHIPFEVEP